MEPICKVKILPIKDDFIYHYDQNGCPLVRICPGQYVTSGDKSNKTLITCKCPNDMYLVKGTYGSLKIPPLTM